jgi:hypothetical protein
MQAWGSGWRGGGGRVGGREQPMRDGERILEGEMNCVARDCRECMDGRSRRAGQGSQGTTRDDREGTTGTTGTTGCISARVEAFGRGPVRAQRGQRHSSGRASSGGDLEPCSAVHVDGEVAVLVDGGMGITRAAVCKPSGPQRGSGADGWRRAARGGKVKRSAACSVQRVVCSECSQATRKSFLTATSSHAGLRLGSYYAHCEC